MATRFVLPSGQEVTRAWNGDGFRFELCASTPGEPVKLLPDDVAELAAIAALAAHDPETLIESQKPDVERESVDPDTFEVTKS